MARPVSQPDLRDLLHWLENRTGLRFREDQVSGTMAILCGLTEQLGISRAVDLKFELDNRPAVMDQLVNQLTVGETYFFREPAQFELIRETILPEIMGRRGLGRPIKAWSAGCASGEEAYSLAIVCHQHFHADQVTILATDISQAALRKARQATFRPWSFRGNAMAVAQPHLQEIEGRFQLHETIKNRVDFRPLNLAANIYPSAATATLEVDLILCRNVLIYFGPQTIREIGKRFAECLAPGGWLLTAAGDPPLGESGMLETVATAAGIAYRKPLSPDPRASKSLASKSRASPPLAGMASRARQRSSTRHDVPPHRLSQDFVVPPPLQRPSPARTPLGESAAVPDRLTPPAAVGSATPRRADPAGALHAGAWAALGEGDFQRAASLTVDRVDDPQACLIHVKATAATDLAAALEKCRQAVDRHALSEELHYLHGVLLVDANRSLEALQSLQKAIFLNRSSIMAHFLFGSIQRQQGQLESAGRHFRNVCRLCASQPPGRALPLASGETVADIAIAAESQLAAIEAMETES